MADPAGPGATAKEYLARALEEMCEAVAADGGAALYLDDGAGSLQLVAAVGLAGTQPAGLLDRLVGRDKMNGRTIMLSVPGGGVVVVARRSGGNFTRQDRTVAGLFIRRLSENGVATGNGIARPGWTQQLEAIQRIAARLTRLASIEDVGATLCRGTNEVIDHDEAHLLLVADDGALHSVAATGMPGTNGPVKPLPETGPIAETMAHALRGGVPVLARELTAADRAHRGPYSLMVVPLCFETRVTGLIVVLARGGQRFDDDDLRVLQILADQAAVAIENARLLRGRDELVQELAGLLDVSSAAGSAADEGQLAGLLAARLRGATHTDAALISRWEEGSTTLRILHREGIGGDAAAVDVADSPARRAVLRDGRTVVVQADGTDGDPETVQLRQIGARTLILLPLSAGGRTIGMIELIAMVEPRRPSAAEIQTCEAMASLAATGLEKVRLLTQLRDAADMDLITEVHNHRYLQERLRQEVARSARSHSPLAVLMLDLDKFKPINDRHGHADGDRVLHNIGAALRAEVRANDIVARYGGDEFIVLMPDTALEQAEYVARRVVNGVSRCRHELSDGSRATVGVSAGLAVYPSDGRTSTELLQAADAAMYTAKRGGGLRVERSTLAPLGEPVAARALG